RGAGGRGVAPSLGVLGVNAWPGVPVMVGGLGAGKALSQTALGGLAARGLLVPILTRTHGGRGALDGGSGVPAEWEKRMLGHPPPKEPTMRAYLHRLLFDADPIDETVEVV